MLAPWDGSQFGPVIGGSLPQCPYRSCKQDTFWAKGMVGGLLSLSLHWVSWRWPVWTPYPPLLGVSVTPTDSRGHPIRFVFCFLKTLSCGVRAGQMGSRNQVQQQSPSHTAIWSATTLGFETSLTGPRTQQLSCTC